MTRFIKIFTSDAVFDDHRKEIELGTDMVRSKDRVRDNAEVFTPDWLVNNMIDLIEEPVTPATSHLEPSCSNGQFLMEIIRRKLAWIDEHGDDDADRKAAATIIALSTTVGVDISVRNVREAPDRILDMAAGNLHSAEWRELAEAVVSSNNVVGNMLKVVKGHPGGSAELKKMKDGDRRLFMIDQPDRFSEKIRVIRVAVRRLPEGHALVLSSGLLDGEEEFIGVFLIDDPRDGIVEMAAQIRNIAECDECQMLGEEPKILRAGHLDIGCEAVWMPGFPSPADSNKIMPPA